jgi:hypothetical protein
VRRSLATAAAIAAASAAGCGGARHASDAPVRALTHRYVNAMVAHDWVGACALLTPEAAERHHRGAPSSDCPHALAFDAGAGLAGAPGVHPERAGEELAALRVNRVTMLGDKAQVHLGSFPGEEEFILLAVRRAGTWLLAQDLQPGIPVDSWSGTSY